MMTRLQWVIVFLILMLAYALLTSDSIHPADKESLAMCLVIGAVMLERAAHRWFSR